MSRRTCSLLLFALGLGMAVGCGAPAAPSAAVGGSNPAIEEAMAQLAPEDQTLARAQKFCAVSGEPLGSMGVPLKLTLDSQAVFLCCQGCEARAKAQPQETVTRAAKFTAGEQPQ